VHFAACTPNFLILEYRPDDRSPRKDVFKGDPLMVKDGYLPIPDKPGWGLDMNEEWIRGHAGANWHRGFNYGPDGGPNF
jgi:galactonate dehydratase